MRRKLQMDDDLLRPADQVTRLILAIFRLNGELIAAGDQLVADLPLTSSRWQVLSVIAASPAPLPVASIARNMGLTRQGVRASVKELAKAGLVEFASNPHHRRAHLVLITPEGKRVDAAATALQRPWAKALGHGLPSERLADAVDLIQTLCARLSGSRKPGSHL